MRAILLVILFVACCTSAAEISFNSNYTIQCGGAGGCSFNNSAIWIGGSVPGINDSVVISNCCNTSEYVITVVIDNMSLSLANVSLSGNVVLLVQNNANLTFPTSGGINVMLDDSATLTVDHSSVTCYNLIGGSLQIQNGSNVIGSGSIGMIAPNDVTVISSSVTSKFIHPFSTINATNSILNGVVSTDYLYYYGNVTFQPTSPTIFTYGYFQGNPNLFISTLLLVNSTRIEIVDCVSTISEVNQVISSPAAVISFSTSSPNFTATVGDVLNFGGEIQIGDGVHFSVGGGRGSLVVGDDVIVNVTGGSESGSPFSLMSLQTDYTEIVVYGPGQLNLPYSGVINASITTYTGGIVQISGNVTLSSGSSAATAPCVSGSGSVSISGSLQCPGQVVSAGSIELGSNTVLNASLQVTYLVVSNPSTINGNVSVTNGGSKFSNGPLTVNGWFSQNLGSVNISQGTSTLPTPFLQVNGSISFANTSAYINVLPPISTTKVLFASSLNSTATADIAIKESLSLSSTVTISVEGKDIYLVYTADTPKKTFLDKWLVPIAIGGGIVVTAGILLIIVLVVRKRSRRHHYHRVV